MLACSFIVISLNNDERKRSLSCSGKVSHLPLVRTNECSCTLLTGVTGWPYEQPNRVAA
jgi:hypothetical protein